MAIALATDDFLLGGLRDARYARPGKLFTANRALIEREVGKLKEESFTRVADAIVKMLKASTSQ